MASETAAVDALGRRDAGLSGRRQRELGVIHGRMR